MLLAPLGAEDDAQLVTVFPQFVLLDFLIPAVDVCGFDEAEHSFDESRIPEQVAGCFGEAEDFGCIRFRRGRIWAEFATNADTPLSAKEAADPVATVLDSDFAEGCCKFRRIAGEKSLIGLCKCFGVA
jgi:hypothetical protein